MNIRYFNGTCDLILYDLITTIPFIIPIQGDSETNVVKVVGQLCFERNTHKNKFPQNKLQTTK